MALPKAGLELVAENAERYIGDLNRSSQAADGLDRSVAQAADGVSARGSAMQGVFQGVGMAAVDMAVQAGGALVSFVGDSISAAGDFEGGMNLFAAAAGDMGQAELGEFKDLFLSLGKELPVSTQEVQDAAIALVRGGIDPAVVEAGALRDSLLFAAAAGMDLEKAAELSVKQLGTFVPVGASVEAQTRFMAESQELLVKAANASTLNVDALGDAMLQAGGQAQAAGLEYDDFVTTMGLISPAFGSAAEAGTSFKNFLVRLQPSTKPAAAAMEELGLTTFNLNKAVADFRLPPSATIEDAADAIGEYAATVGMTEAETAKLLARYQTSVFYDAEGQFVGMEKAAQLLQDATEGLSDAERVHYLQTIFGNDAMGAANALANGGAEAYQAFAAKMLEANGVQEQAAATQQGFNFQMENLMGSLEALQITIGSAVLPVLTELISAGVTPAVNAITAFAEQISAADDPLQAVADLLGVTGGTAGALGGVVQELAEQHLTRLTDAWNQDVMPAVTTAQQFFQDDVLPILDDLGQVVLPMVDASLDVAAGVWENVLVPALKVAWAFLDGVLIPIVKDVAAWMADKLPPAIRTASQFFTGTLLPAVKTTFEFVETKVIPIVEAVAKVLEVTLVKALEVAGDAWELYLKPGLESMGSWLTGTFKPIIDNLATWLGSVTGGFQGIQEAIGWVLGKLAELATAIENLPDLPDVYTPGSPTPAELGFLGIAKALEIATPRVESFSAASAGLGRVAPDMPPVAASAGGGSITLGGSVGVSLSMRGELGRFIDARVDSRVNAIADASARRKRGGS